MRELIIKFHLRTLRHIKDVVDNLIYVSEFAECPEEILERAHKHDISKFSDPEREGYIWLAHKLSGHELSEDKEQLLREVTIHHVSTNSHHPEYHCKEFQIAKNRDSIPDKPCVPASMGYVDLIEMVCDWDAVGKEKGNTARSWADKNIGKRWIFDEEQKEIIYDFIEILEKR